MTAPLIEVPALDIDALMEREYGCRLSPNGVLECRIVAHLCAHLAKRLWAPCRVDDGEEPQEISDVKAAMELIFNLDDCWIYFRCATGGEHWVRLVLGNGEDIISDWSFSEGDRDGFNAEMEAFKVEEAF